MLFLKVKEEDYEWVTANRHRSEEIVILTRKTGITSGDVGKRLGRCYTTECVVHELRIRQTMILCKSYKK